MNKIVLPIAVAVGIIVGAALAVSRQNRRDKK